MVCIGGEWSALAILLPRQEPPVKIETALLNLSFQVLKLAKD
jgi:hypothetical protein